MFDPCRGLGGAQTAEIPGHHCETDHSPYHSPVAVVLDRLFLRAAGPDAVGYLQSMVSNDVAAIAPGGGCYALLLTPKARIVADLELFRVGEELIAACAPPLRDEVLATLLRSRFRAKVELAPRDAALVWGDGEGALATLATPAGPLHLLAEEPAERGDPAAWEVARVEAGLPAYGSEFDASSMPAEAGLVERAVSFSKGCYPGQEPVARLHYRGHANRGLRGLAFEDGLAEPGAEVAAGGRAVGRVTTAVESPQHGPIALAILRREVEDGQRVLAGGRPATVRPLPFA
jgi:folate-binding protein YgfZ